MSTLAPVNPPPTQRFELNTLPIDQRRGAHGMWCLITTESMLFIAMFASYYYLGNNKNRWAVEEAPHLGYAFILLAVLLSSSFVLYWGERNVKAGNYRTGRIALWITVAMGLVFLVLQSFEYLSHWKTLTPYSDSYGSIFYTITTLHGAHVIVGLLLLMYVGVMPRYGETRGSPHRPFETVALYWHFVDAVWVFVVLLLYVIPHFQGQPHVR